MAFNPPQLLQALAVAPAARAYSVAFSGGLDSYVLLHAMSALRGALNGAELRAVHIHHGLHADADDWVRLCQQRCAALSVPLRVLRVDADALPGQSPEAAAREARYRALASLMSAGDVLLTAHHRDDQAETLLLQLLRGCGPRGLAAMPVVAPFAAGTHIRPLLDVPRNDLLEYAQAGGLQWVEDSSNADVRFDRNFVRAEILPRLRSRWPAVADTLSRSARHCAEAAELLESLAVQDLRTLGGTAPACLPVGALCAWPPPRRRNVLRHWLQVLRLPLPSSAQLERIMLDVLTAQADANPCVHWPGAEVRRYRGHVYAMRPLPPVAKCAVIHWDVREPLCGSELMGCLRMRSVRGRGVTADLCAAGRVTVRFRQGGEACRPSGRHETHTLKKLLQEHGVPPWQRERLPLIYLDDQLAAVADLWVCEPFAAEGDAPGYCIEWQPDWTGGGNER